MRAWLNWYSNGLQHHDFEGSNPSALVFILVYSLIGDRPVSTINKLNQFNGQNIALRMLRYGFDSYIECLWGIRQIGEAAVVFGFDKNRVSNFYLRYISRCLEVRILYPPLNHFIVSESLALMEVANQVRPRRILVKLRASISRNWWRGKQL